MAGARDPSGRRPMGRREALLLGALVVGGCARGSDESTTGLTTSSSKGTSTAAPQSPTSGSPAGTPPSSASPSPSVSPTRPVAVPSRASLVAEFGDRQPRAFGMELKDVVSRLRGDGVALTFDACGGPGGGDGVDHQLLDTLRRHDVPATLFLNLRWIVANPGLAADLADEPLFELANHGKRHRPLTVREQAAYGIHGTENVGAAVDEIEAASGWFVEHTGGRPRWFRPGTAHVDDVAAQIAVRLHEPVAGFSVNADLGATATPAYVARAVRSVRPGDIVIGHLNRPGRGTAAGVAKALPGLLDSGVRFRHLTES